jgi:hypothetical protein
VELRATEAKIDGAIPAPATRNPTRQGLLLPLFRLPLGPDRIQALKDAIEQAAAAKQPLTIRHVATAVDKVLKAREATESVSPWERPATQ